MKSIIKFIGELVKRFSSRKFLLTLAGGLTLAANQQWTELVILLTGYTGIEGFADITQRKASATGDVIINQLPGAEVETTSDSYVGGIVSGDSLQ